jgi:hypothetical protein
MERQRGTSLSQAAASAQQEQSSPFSLKDKTAICYYRAKQLIVPQERTGLAGTAPMKAGPSAQVWACLAWPLTKRRSLRPAAAAPSLAETQKPRSIPAGRLLGATAGEGQRACMEETSCVVTRRTQDSNCQARPLLTWNVALATSLCKAVPFKDARRTAMTADLRVGHCWRNNCLTLRHIF